MADAVKNETNNPEVKPQEEEKKVTGKTGISGKTTEKILEEIEMERKQKMEEQRFGYFSIPYPAIVGDEAYSKDAEYHHQIVDRKVITEKRGIYVQGPKSGNTPDVYFPPPEFPEKMMKQKEEDNKIREEKEKKRIIEEKEEQKRLKEKYPFKFKPAGPQIAFNFYKNISNEDEKTLNLIEKLKPKLEPNMPLTFEPDKKRFKIDHFKVKTEERNVQAHASKTGTYPSDYFGFYRVDEDLQKKLDEMNKQDVKDKLEKVKQSKNAVHKEAFKPASMNKCEPFINDRGTFQLHNDEEMEVLLKQYKEDKKKGNERYKKPEIGYKHPKPFSPAKMQFQGRDGLFMFKSEDFYLNKDKRYDKEFQKEEKKKKEGEKKIPIREIRELENQNKRKPFTYNKLMKSSTFAPPISSYFVNIKRDFPTIKFH